MGRLKSKVQVSVAQEWVEVCVKTMSERMQKIRTDLKISQEEMGKLVGLHYVSVARIEKGLTRLIDLRVLIQMSRKLKATTDYLLGLAAVNTFGQNNSDNPYDDAVILDNILGLTPKQREHIVGIISEMSGANKITTSTGEIPTVPESSPPDSLPSNMRDM